MTYRSVVIVLAMLAGASCRTPRSGQLPLIVQPGAPGEASRVISAAAAVDLSNIGTTAADIRFMQGMIGHHAQALEMTALVPTRTQREDLRMLARRIEASQADEIQMMREWLAARGETTPAVHAGHSVPDGHANHSGPDADPNHSAGGGLMPGMLTPDEMDRLANAKGAAFEALFLQFMIKHHEGALVMVNDLFAQPAAGQDSEVFTFASDVDADQRMEIARMGTLLEELRE